MHEQIRRQKYEDNDLTESFVCTNFISGLKFVDGLSVRSLLLNCVVWTKRAPIMLSLNSYAFVTQKTFVLTLTELF